MGTVHACHQVNQLNQLRPLHFVTPLLVIPRESGTMLVSTEFYLLSERPCLFSSRGMLCSAVLCLQYMLARPNGWCY